MAGEWNSRPLRELTENFDSIRVPVKEADRKPGPYPYYGASGVVDHVDQFLFDGEYLLIGEDGENLRTRNTPVAFLARGKFWVNNHAHILLGKSGDGDTRYLMYALAVTDISGYLTGSTMPKLTQGNLNRIPVIAPPLKEQQAIACILGALDDKIELNRRRNRTLEALARATFHSWFVVFDPVNAKSAGRTPPGLKPELAALFPDSFADSPLGPIPAGWHIGTLGEVAENPRRGIAAEEIESSTPYIALEHMPRRSIALADWATADAIESNKFEFHRGEILFGKLRPYFHKVGIAPVDGVCSTDILVMVPKKPDWFGFCVGHFSSEAIIQHTDRASTGTKMPRTNWSDLARFEVVIPSVDVAAAFTRHFKPMIDSIHQAIGESRTLAALRDALLPKLISGELRVPDADRIVGRAT